MNTPTEYVVHQLRVNKIKVLIARTREKEGWKALRDSMADHGLKLPVSVVDISNWPREKRLNREGQVCDWGLIKGQGRLEAAIDLGWKTIPAFIKDVPMSEVIALHWSENFDREDLPWSSKGWLIRAEMKTGTSLEDLCAQWKISPQIARRYLALLDKAATPEVLQLPVNTAEALTQLPARGQKLVLDIAKETDTPIHEITAEARKLESEGKEWTKTELRKALTKYDDDLVRVRKRLKVLRLHASLGPANLELVLSDDEAAQAAMTAGLNLDKLFSTLK